MVILCWEAVNADGHFLMKTDGHFMSHYAEYRCWWSLYAGKQ